RWLHRADQSRWSGRCCWVPGLQAWRRCGNVGGRTTLSCRFRKSPPHGDATYRSPAWPTVYRVTAGHDWRRPRGYVTVDRLRVSPNDQTSTRLNLELAHGRHRLCQTVTE